MTHTLHRRGTPENLGNDYVILAMSAKGINEVDSAPRLREFLRIAARHKPVNMGDMKTGNTFAVPTEKIIENVQDTSIVHAVFADTDSLAAAIKDIAAADLGVSVVVSGLLEATRECCAGVGTPHHTVEHSLGIWGRTDLLPSDAVLQVATMCGHGMVAHNLVTSLAADVKAGRITAKAAAASLAEPCVCGIFNPVRAEALLKAMAAS